MTTDNGYMWSDFVPHTTAFIFPQLARVLKNKQDRCILDIGCGNGVTASKLLESGYDVYGIDASESGITIANNRNPGRFFLQDISSETLPEPLQNKNFDTIISTEVIEHIYSPRTYMKFIRSIVESSGGGNLSSPHLTTAT
jgi:2-polyprenyl-3-methyl-5-hydroxy-6-metoxy-1,4-benzoquinol methylase